MSQEEILNTLRGLGLTKLDAEVYIFLAKRGPLKGADIARGVKAQKQPLYRSLKVLQSKGIVTATLQRPAKFVAVPFDRVIDIFVKTKMAEAQRIQETKNEILAHWQDIAIGETEDASAKFNLIEGRGPVYAKILRMMNDAHQLSTITTVTGLLRADQFGLFKPGIASQIKTLAKFRALTELSKENLSTAKKLLKEISSSKINFEGRSPEIHINIPQLVIKDENEILFFITPKTNSSNINQEDTCLWTNCKSLVQAFITVFDEFWRNGTDLNAKIAELECGKPVTKTQIIEDPKAASKKYNETIRSAIKEVIIVTSPMGLMTIGQDKSLQNIWSQNGVTAKIMAPITRGNFEVSKQFSNLCEVRHVHLGYLETTIVDGQHLFQFRQASERVQSDFPFRFENTFYTNDSEYVEKTSNMLNEIWAKAQVPSNVTPELVPEFMKEENSLDGAYPRTIKKMYNVNFEFDKRTKLTEEGIINQIITEKRHVCSGPSDFVRTFGSNGGAVVHPPVQLGLPDLFFHVYHMEKHSSFGAGDSIIVNPLVETPKGFAYVPSAVITDNHYLADFWKKVGRGSPAEINVRLVKKNELEVRIHGCTMFAGWTVQISLLDRVLPPVCLQVEGYGKVKSGAYTVALPSGFVLKTAGNVFEAFVKFFHPSSNYSGPGTDGIFGRDVIMEFSLPKKQD